MLIIVTYWNQWKQMFIYINRSFIDEQESSMDHLEQKLERAIKMCTIAVDSGKEYVKNQR